MNIGRTNTEAGNAIDDISGSRTTLITSTNECDLVIMTSKNLKSHEKAASTANRVLEIPKNTSCQETRKMALNNKRHELL